MSHIRMAHQARLALVALLFMAVVAPSIAVRAAAADLDAAFATSYTFQKGFSYVIYNCSSYVNDGNCEGTGYLGPFVRPGCIIEGVASTTGNVVTRAIYIVDVNSGKTGNGVKLFRYLKTDTIDAATSDDTVAVRFTNSVELPLVGSANATCFVAGNSNFLFIGTNQTSALVQVQKSSLILDSSSVGPPGSQITYITADQQGFITAGYLTPGGVAVVLLYGPDGEFRFSANHSDAILLTPYTGYSITSNTTGVP